MGRGKQKIKKTAEGNLGLQRKNSKVVCKNQACETEEPKNSKPGRKPKAKPPRIIDADLLKITIDHFCGSKIKELIDKIPEPRKIEMCTYSISHLFWLGVLMFSFRLKSRNQLLKERETVSFHSNLLSLSSTCEEYVAHPDTMNYLFERLPSQEFGNIKAQLVKELI